MVKHHCLVTTPCRPGGQTGSVRQTSFNNNNIHNTTNERTNLTISFAKIFFPFPSLASCFALVLVVLLRARKWISRRPSHEHEHMNTTHMSIHRMNVRMCGVFGVGGLWLGASYERRQFRRSSFAPSSTYPHTHMLAGWLAD